MSSSASSSFSGQSQASTSATLSDIPSSQFTSDPFEDSTPDERSDKENGVEELFAFKKGDPKKRPRTSFVYSHMPVENREHLYQ